MNEREESVYYMPEGRPELPNERKLLPKGSENKESREQTRMAKKPSDQPSQKGGNLPEEHSSIDANNIMLFLDEGFRMQTTSRICRTSNGIEADAMDDETLSPSCA
ncbi:uncharacterized protein MEPE_05564 [Melanopsichium pennsylvanicum]|uniref:Uncharacterized protein n=1 Tax=Melanopsichium pennsylvanicum TaxID=63383 RepID=A0AAJ4XQC8_9BASI|nr:uncharacterized protein MEPE_05564 [Melanopsichium pennsylvanicum]